MKIKKETLLNALKAALLALFFLMLWGDMPVKVFAEVILNVTVQQGSSKEVTVSVPTAATPDHMEGVPNDSEWASLGDPTTDGDWTRANVMISPGTNVAPGSYTLTVYWEHGYTSVVNITVVAKTSSDTQQPEENNSGNTDPNPHEHQFEWVTIRKATETEDGEAVYKCRICDAIENKESVGAMFVFNNNVIDKIKKYPARRYGRDRNLQMAFVYGTGARCAGRQT